MDNPRADKVAVISEVKERLQQSPSVVVTEYRGLSVKALAELRRSLRPAGGKYKVYKNTLVRRAASEAGIDLEEHLVGPTALTFTETTPEGEAGDVVTVAKVLKEFARSNPELVIKGGLLDGVPLDADGVRQLADIEPREVLLAKLAGLMAAPLQQFAGLLQAVPRDFAYGLQALIDKGGAGEAVAAADGASEAPAPAEAGPEADTAAEPEVEAEASAPEQTQTENETDEPAAEAAGDDGED
jgi:large subunit ribosomal protein L10